MRSALIRDITPEKDDKLQRLKSLLGGELRRQKVLLFTYYKDTARYLFRELGMEKGNLGEFELEHLKFEEWIAVLRQKIVHSLSRHSRRVRKQ